MQSTGGASRKPKSTGEQKVNNPPGGGKHEVNGGELRITNYELRITNYELRITNYELRILAVIHFLGRAVTGIRN
jgi:hypothetical protein